MSTDALEAPKTEGFSLSDLITKQIADSFAADSATPEIPKSEPAAPKEPAADPGKTEKPDPKAEKEPKTEPIKESTIEDFLGEEKPKDDKPAADDADDDDEAPEDVKAQGEKAVARWGDLKKTTREQAKEIERLTREVEEAKGKTPAASGDVTARIEELEKALADRERVIAAVSVTDSIEYKESVSIPASKLEKKASELSDDPAISESMVEAVFEPDPKKRHAKLAEICDGLPDFTQRKLERIADEVEALMEKRDELFANAQTAKQEIERNKLVQKTEETAKEKAARIAASETVWKNIVEKLPFLSDGNGGILPEFKDIAEKGKGGITDETSIGAKAFAAYAVHLVPKMDTMLKKRDARIAELESSVKALRGATPPMDTGSETDPHSDETLAEKIVRMSRG